MSETNAEKGNVREFPAELVRRIAKAELHVHLEGTVDGATLFELCEKHGVSPPAPSVAEVERWFCFDDFPQFLERFTFVAKLFQGADDFALVTKRYLQRALEMGIVHVEFYVSTVRHFEVGGMRWSEVSDGIAAGAAAVPGACPSYKATAEWARAEGHISWALIPSMTPQLGFEENKRSMVEVVTAPGPHVVAVGMAGAVEPWWTDDYGSVFDMVRAAGFKAVSHAGERGSAKEVRHAVERFGVVRLQHGIGAMEDDDVLQLVKSRGIACDVCPGSNIALKSVPSPAEHPLGHMLEAGLTVTLASDDPPMFQTNVLEEYRRAWEWCAVGVDGILSLAENSLRHSFAPQQCIDVWCSSLADSERYNVH
mmetsp:Transcript_14260/g.56156  ORF Transcript_14260/g.56156 Transcript_14260/m.56156 type:complete len:367 (+) Transcript_14260:101-1201(+)